MWALEQHLEEERKQGKRACQRPMEEQMHAIQGFVKSFQPCSSPTTLPPPSHQWAKFEVWREIKRCWLAQEMQLQANIRPTIQTTKKIILLRYPLSSLSNPFFQPFRHSSAHYLHLSTSSSSQWFSLLRTAISTSNLRLGKSIHAHIIIFGHSANRFSTNNLITMYSKCGSLSDARLLFDKAPNRDIVTWNSILAAYALSADANDGLVHEGFCLFRLLHSSSAVSPTKHTLAPALKLGLISGYVWASEAIHGYAVKIGLELDVFVSGALINIYCKSGRITDARVLFNDLPESDRDAVLWNVMLKAYVHMGLEKEACTFFSDFHHGGLGPDDVSVQCILSGFPEVKFDQDNKFVEQVQAYATKLFLYNDTLDVILWNKTLCQHYQAGEIWAAFECFLYMSRSNVGYDRVTLIVALAATVATNDMELGQQIHGLAFKSGFDLDTAVANSLINMYSKAGCFSFARKVFSGMQEMDLISRNSMIAGCMQNGLEAESVTLFLDLLRDDLRPDHFTLATVLKAVASLTPGLSLSEQIHVQALKTGIVTDSFVSTALTDVYSRRGKMEEAEFLFQNQDEIDLASWNAMIFGYINCNNCRKALELFTLMHKSGERPDEITLATVAKACSGSVGLEQGRQMHAHAVKLGVSSELYVGSGILDMYIKCGDMVDAFTVFEEIPARDDVAWTAMISGCVENGDEACALLIYHQMRESGVLPDEYTFATLIKASSCSTALERGRQIHAEVIKSDYASDPFVGTSLIDMYAKCGNIEDAYCLFMRIDVRSITLWNAMLVGLAQHGHGREALNLFRDMEIHGMEPDRVSFIGVLSACSHSGLICEAYLYFQSMLKDYGIQPEVEHYSCLVDALGRAGRLQEAEKLIASMPFEASSAMYRALLGACRVQGDRETGTRVATRLLALEPSDSSVYVLLSNIYAAANKWDEVTDARKMMHRKNVKKDPGFSLD
ncbi:unnamed protein product [Ilex paraguariensis]|uniref:Pentatricopeptide repeat-containing protein n=2 Tax=Ilex paraguariensis TaxID=185542 RepID=A0ABC8U5U0_9AQUA